MQACLLTPKGKLLALLWVVLQEEAILLEAPWELSELLQARLERYLVADDVVLEGIPSEPTIHVFGSLLDDPTVQQLSGVAIRRLALPGKDILMSELPKDFLKEHPLWNEESIEILRIEQGIPQWGAELTSDRFPPEAHLERHAIDYNKGCYVGQEIISRLRSVGHVHRLLVSLIAEREGDELLSNMQIVSPEAPERVIGWITSAIQQSNSKKFIALGYVSFTYHYPDSRLLALHENSKQTSSIIVRK
jgi:folate-binding protein YgfZ